MSQAIMMMATEKEILMALDSDVAEKKKKKEKKKYTDAPPAVCLRWERNWLLVPNNFF